MTTRRWSCLPFDDPDHSATEQRYITVEMSNAGQALNVAHADRGEDVRIISARKTTRSERSHYEETNREAKSR
jgi:uncharacterized protein